MAAVLVTAAPAMAQNADDTALEEIIVTAQFRNENLQETPVAITAISADVLEARNQTNLAQIAAQAPNVTLKPAGQNFGPSMIAFIRGVGQTDSNFALEPGVGIYVDDVYYSTLTGSLLDLMDLDRVEVLRGPQGTLAGRNSIGGAIKLYTRTPRGDDSANVQVTYGSYNLTEARAMADTSLIDNTLFARISGVGRQRDGYVRVLDYGCTHPGSGVPVFRHADGCNNGTYGGQKYVATRLALRWIASDAVDVNFSADYLNDSSETAAGTLLFGYSDNVALNTIYAIDDGNPATPVVGFNGTANSTGVLNNHRFVPYGRYHDPSDPINDPYVTYATLCDYTSLNSPTVPGNINTMGSAGVNWKPFCAASENSIRMWGASAKLDWRINGDMTLTSITAYRTYDTTFNQDVDQSPIAVSIGNYHMQHHQTSEELRLNGSIGQLADWTLGGFYFDQNGDFEARVDLNYTIGNAPLLPGLRAPLDFLHGPDPTPARTWAVFAHSVWHLQDRLNLTTGIRYSDDRKDYTHRRHNPDGSNIVVPPGPPTLYPADPPIPNARLAGLNGSVDHFKDSRIDWRVALDYRWTEQLMTYAQVSTGYKGGGVNPRPFFVVQLGTFKPETMTAYEIGFKSTLMKNLRLNGAVFYNDYKDIQLTLTQCALPNGSIGGPCLKPANVGDAKVKGAELEFEYRPVSGLTFDGSASYLDFYYSSLTSSSVLVQDPLASQLSPIARLDMVTPYTPKVKWSLGASYQLPQTRAGTFTLRLDADHQSEVYTDATNSVFNQIDAYTLLNGRLTWKPSSDWEVALEALNITDKLYYLSIYDQHQQLNPGGTSSTGQVTGQPGMPRTLAVTLRRKFQ
ncbi:MAG: TonB-dependent receptor [Gammaproteobacteria bacterium]|nr:TonB-dependent receptor [Gammaproteobacteria bacterium]